MEGGSLFTLDFFLLSAANKDELLEMITVEVEKIINTNAKYVP